MYWKIKPQITNNVAAYRKSAKLTQAVLADKSGVTRQTIIALEKGDYVPSVALALKLARILGTSVEQILSLKEDT
jgi:putative transcriptional regulator